MILKKEVKPGHSDNIRTGELTILFGIYFNRFNENWHPDNIWYVRELFRYF